MVYPALTLLSLSWLALAAGTTASRCSPGAKRPNFVVIMTDDQDKLLNSVDYQPAVQKHFVEQGTTFDKHFCTMSQCCPSRVSYLTGRTGHNTNITDVAPPHGGYTKFISEGLNDNYAPVWMQEAGYNTYYTGKLMNRHSTRTYNDPYPKGFNQTNFLIEPNVYVYYNATYQRNQDLPYYLPGRYSTDVLAETAVEFLEHAASDMENRPFFINIMPVGPHFEKVVPVEPGQSIAGTVLYPPVPAKRHEHLFPNATPGESSYLKDLPRLNETVVDYLDHYYRRRLQALAAVDELVDDVFAKLDELDLLDNTYVIYTTDNGYHIGNHRMNAGKTTCYEEDVNIPMYFRGPGVAKGKTIHYPTTHTDLVPTIFELAGIPLRPEFDGAPMPVTKEIPQKKYEHVNIEFWGVNLEEGEYSSAIRLIGTGYDLMYVTWCTNEHELYDMKTDAAQMHNLHSSQGYLFGYPISKVLTRLNGLMMVLKSCKGQDCIYPWSVTHPEGDVRTIRDAMDPRFDQFYEEEMPVVVFDKCVRGYFTELEGPQVPAVFGGASSGKRSLD
ncbi:related to arylsulfatase [Cephalotrichum gorgonifer]|uniref:Related to arylsulfatase n=1 Tax=Cephalotrichum gorgonifer TaxID=2041049 RepID=A0AAE8SS61_9PEZI|nr:related to arylsulfatase [Cephalotrichum gorgonifer]